MQNGYTAELISCIYADHMRNALTTYGNRAFKSLNRVHHESIYGATFSFSKLIYGMLSMAIARNDTPLGSRHFLDFTEYTSGDMRVARIEYIGLKGFTDEVVILFVNMKIHEMEVVSVELSINGAFAEDRSTKAVKSVFKEFIGTVIAALDAVIERIDYKSIANVNDYISYCKRTNASKTFNKAWGIDHPN